MGVELAPATSERCPVGDDESPSCCSIRSYQHLAGWMSWDLVVLAA